MNEITTSSRISEKYLLHDGRTATILRAKACTPVPVKNCDGVLWVGSLQIVFRPMGSVHAQMLSLGGADHGILNRLREDMGGHFPGVYLFDLLCKNIALTPLFPDKGVVVFLGSKAACTMPEAILDESLVVIPRPGAPKKNGMLDWVFFRKRKQNPVPEIVSMSPEPRQELGYFALVNCEGVVLPWFVSETDLVNLIRSDDQDHFILEAREPT
jgi:hypothetical protein